MKDDVPEAGVKSARLDSMSGDGTAAWSDSVSSPSVRSPKSQLLYDAYQAYHDRLEKGEKIDPDEYCAQHPQMQSSLAKLLQLHSFLQQNDDLASTFEYPKVGASFLHFTLLHELGEGAFAKVFLADDTELGRRAALKLSRRAKAEAKLMGPIEHKNIVLVHSIAEDRETGLTAICMPYRGSATLEDVLDEIQAQGEMPAKADVILEAVRYLPIPLDTGSSSDAANPILQDGAYVDGVRLIGAQIADALTYLHAHEICHRDLKPSNILMTPSGMPMLLDFNLSTDFQSDSTSIGGTLPYMAPEVLSAIASKEPPAPTLAAGAKADIYSFGVLLYQLLTGKHPLGVWSLKLSTAELRDQLLARQKQGVIPVRAVNPQVDRPLSDLIQRCLASDPAERPASADDIAAALKPNLRRAFRRRASAFAGLFLCLLFLGAAGLGNVFRAPDPMPLAEESYRQGEFAETVTHCNAALLTDPESPRALRLSARSKQKLGLYDLAITDYGRLENQLRDGRYHASIGYCCNCLARHKDAAAAYKEAVKLNFDTAIVRNNLGYSLLKSHSSAEMSKAAVAFFDRAIQSEPELATPYYNRALIATEAALRLRTNQTVQNGAQMDLAFASGIQDFKNAMQCGEDSASVYFNAALLCASAATTDQQRTNEAVKYLVMARQRGQDMEGLKHVGFNTMRTEIAAANLNEIAILMDKSAPAVRFLDPIAE